MRANPAPIAVADYCKKLNEKTVIVNNDYQRGDGVWTPHARSYFIESILLEYPVPKFYLYSKVDLRTRETVKEIVDGQQRSQALQYFYNNRMRLSTKIETEELRGKRYKDLEAEWQSRFLSYSLPIDEFSGVSDDEIQESFRRMNANNVPLNAEEQRNAKFQGEFKWFLLEVSQRYRQPMQAAKLFNKRDLIRMVDIRTYARISTIIDRGFITVKSNHIDNLYRTYDKSLPSDHRIVGGLPIGLDFFLNEEFFHQKPFLSFHMFESLTLAYLSVNGFNYLFESAADVAPEIAELVESIEITLEDLVNSLLTEDRAEELQPFVDAASKGTNVNKASAIRFLYIRNALRSLG